MANRLTKKEKGFIRDYVKTGNGTVSILNNYDTTDENTAASMASENLTKPKIINAIKSIADRIPEDLLEKVHIEGLNASDEVVTVSGEVIGSKPDYSVRHKYLDSAYKLKGVYAPEEKNINVKVEKLEAIQDATKDILNG